MRIAFLCKRHYTGKDVVLDWFGRLHEIPRMLAAQDHVIRAFCTDYRGTRTTSSPPPSGDATFEWTSTPIRASNPIGMVRYAHTLLQQLEAFGPDVVYGASDIPHAWLAFWLAKRLDVPYAIDLYDNYESFGQARIPGFRRLLGTAVRHASLVTVVSEPLALHARHAYQATGEVLVATNGVDTTVFHPRERARSRALLGLPANARLIGTAGGLSSSKGIDDLYRAWQTIGTLRPDAHLVLAGPRSSPLPDAHHERVHDLGHLSATDVSHLFNALDLGIVTVPDDGFGRYCSPQKAYEMVACGLPLVASRVGVMSALLGGSQAHLYEAGDAEALSCAALSLLDRPVPTPLRAASWDDVLAPVGLALSRMAHGT